jgi:hypothetical protein
MPSVEQRRVIRIPGTPAEKSNAHCAEIKRQNRMKRYKEQYNMEFMRFGLECHVLAKREEVKAAQAFSGSMRSCKALKYLRRAS